MPHDDVICFCQNFDLHLFACQLYYPNYFLFLLIFSNKCYKKKLYHLLPKIPQPAPISELTKILVERRSLPWVAVVASLFWLWPTHQPVIHCLIVLAHAQYHPPVLSIRSVDSISQRKVEGPLTIANIAHKFWFSDLEEPSHPSSRDAKSGYRCVASVWKQTSLEKFELVNETRPVQPKLTTGNLVWQSGLGEHSPSGNLTSVPSGNLTSGRCSPWPDCQTECP